MGTLLALLLLGLLLIQWQAHMAVRETAARAAAALCRGQGYQLLDGTVALAGARLVRSEQGFLVIRRVFQFAYSPEGATRQTGFVIMLGGQVDSIGL